MKPLEVNQQAVRKELDIVLGCLGKELLERSIQVLSEIAGQGFVVAERPPDLRRQFRVGREMLRECEVVLEASVGLIDQVGTPVLLWRLDMMAYLLDSQTDCE